MAANLSELAALVRAHDWARYIAIQFAPQVKRDALITLFAFDAEIDRVIHRASDPLPGEIRVQWWREVLSGERADEARGHPLATALLDVIRRHSLPLAAFDRYLQGKTFAFYHDAFPDTVTFEAWCGDTASSLLQMACLVLDSEAAPAAADASGHGGIAVAVGRILAAMPATRRRGQCYMPQDLLAACGLSREAYVEGSDTAAMASAAVALAALGLSHHDRFKVAARHLPTSLKPALLPVYPARFVLERAAADPADVFTAPIAISSLRQFMSIARAALI
ncbi:MAG: squalene/phytoene synthase family protein [Rhizobiaceae bacterium]